MTRWEASKAAWTRMAEKYPTSSWPGSWSRKKWQREHAAEAARLADALVPLADR